MGQERVEARKGDAVPRTHKYAPSLTWATRVHNSGAETVIQVARAYTHSTDFMTAVPGTPPGQEASGKLQKVVGGESSQAATGHARPGE